MITEIIFQKKISNENEDYYVDYDGNIVENDDKFIDIKNIVHEKQEEWFKKIDLWHDNLNIKFSRINWKWWLTITSRITAWAPYGLKSFIFFLAIIELLKNKKISKLIIINSNKEILNYFIEHQQYHLSKILITYNKESNYLNSIVNFLTIIKSKISILLSYLLLIKKHLI